MKSRQHLSIYFLIVLFGSLLFVPSLGKVHLFDWDEINFAESAREMLLTKNYFKVQINFQPFWEKPPLFIWLQAASMHLFGINEFAARFPNSIIGIITLLVVFSIGATYYDKRFGIIWAIVYAGSFLPHLYFKSAIMDPTFNLFIFLSLFFLFRTINLEPGVARTNMMWIGGLFAGLAVLTKGPVGLLVIILTALIYFIVNKFSRVFHFKEYVIFFVTVALVASAWFAVEVFQNGTWFIQEFITYQIRLFNTQDAGHGGPFIYHFIVLYLGCFPASIFIFNSFRISNEDNKTQTSFKLWMVISLFVVLILFSIVKTKIVHYSSFCYFPLTFLAAYGIWKIHLAKTFLKRNLVIQTTIIGGFISLALLAFPLLLQYKDSWLVKYSHLIKDPFALANLEAHIPWSGYEWLIGLGYLFVILLFVVFKRFVLPSIVFLFVATMVIIEITLNVIVPKIEMFSQGAAISFYIKRQKEDVYVNVYGYKSYAQLFYTQKKPETNPLSISQQWLLEGKIDKPAYFVTKVTNSDLDKMPQLMKIGSLNGFKFYKREQTRLK